jgi:DNA-binding HxlR family transcriptional regulator
MDKNDTIDFPALARILEAATKRMIRGEAMAKAKSALDCGCPVAAFQRMISGKYKLRIVWDLQDGPKRYSEIRTGLLRGAEGSSEIAPRVLSRELKALTESGLIDRRDYGVVPPKVEYRLTRKGKSFVPVIAAIRNWGTRHLAPAGTAQRAIGMAAE